MRRIAIRGMGFPERKPSGTQGKIPPVILFMAMVIPLLVLPVSAGAPPVDDRPAYLLPNLVPPYISASHGDCFFVEDSFTAASPSSLKPPFFSGISGHHAFMNISCNRTGDRYVSGAWYFSDWDEFRQQRDDLFGYLARHGRISNVTISLADELARTDNAWLAGLKTRQVDAVRYESPETSGYFLIFSTDIFPGPNYYIAYYGIAGPAGIEQHSEELEMLVMTAFPALVESRTYRSNPETPMAAQPAMDPAGIAVMAPVIGAFLRALQK